MQGLHLLTAKLLRDSWPLADRWSEVSITLLEKGMVSKAWKRSYCRRHGDVLANSSFTHFLVLLIGPHFLVQSSYRFVFSFSMFLYLRTFLLTLCRCLTWPEVSRRALCLYLCVDVCGLHGDLWQGDCQVVKVVSSQAVKWRKWILEHSFRFCEDLMWIEFVLLLFYLVQMQRSTGHKGSRVESDSEQADVGRSKWSSLELAFYSFRPLYHTGQGRGVVLSCLD